LSAKFERLRIAEDHTPVQRGPTCMTSLRLGLYAMKLRVYAWRTRTISCCRCTRQHVRPPLLLHACDRSTCTLCVVYMYNVDVVIVSTIAQSSAAIVDVELVVHVGGQPSSALVAHLGARRQTSFSTTRYSWRRTLCSAPSSTAPATCKQWRVCCTQHSTAASLSPWCWKCKIEYHTNTHLASYGIVLPCLEVWQLERPVAVIYQSRQSVD